jgi:iron complex transport system substrate-binding protein
MSTFKRFTSLMTLLLLLLALTACVATAASTQVPAEAPAQAEEAAPAQADEATAAPAAQASGDCRTIVHDMGETEVCGTPTTVIALGPHMLDIMLSLGVQAAGFAETQYINEEDLGKPVGNILYLGEYIETMPVNVGDRQDPNLEVITSLNPDLILSELRDEAQLELLQEIAPTLAYRGNQNDEWKRTIVPIAEALNIPEEAERVMAEHDAHIVEKKAELAPIVAEYPRLSFVAQNQEGVLSTFTTGSWAGDLMADLGFELAFFPSDSTATEVSVEQVPELETDIIIIGASGTATPEMAQELWTGNAVLMAHPASVNGRVFFVDYQLWSRLRGPIAVRLVTEELISYLGGE